MIGSELRAALARLASDDPIRSLVELALGDDDPALTAAISRRLLTEIRAEKGFPKETTNHAGRD